MNMIIFGAPGSGKGTYASRLQSKLNVEVISMGDIFRDIVKQKSPLGDKVKDYLDKGLLVPDEVVIEVLKQRLSKIHPRKGFVLDGYPRTIEQAKALEKVAGINAIILLTVPDWIIIERLSTRRICRNCGEVYNVKYLKPKVDMICDRCGGQLYQRSDDTAEVIKERIGVYERQTRPILRHFDEKHIPVVEFKTDKLDLPPEEAVDEILKGLRKIKE